MKFITVRELKINGSMVINRLPREDAVITRRGKPVAALVPIDEDTLEEFIIAHHPIFLAELSRARQEYRKKGGTPLEKIRQRLASRG